MNYKDLMCHLAGGTIIVSLVYNIYQFLFNDNIYIVILTAILAINLIFVLMIFRD